MCWYDRTWIDGYLDRVVDRTRASGDRPVTDTDGAIERAIEFDVLCLIPHDLIYHDVPQQRIVFVCMLWCGGSIGARGGARSG